MWYGCSRTCSRSSAVSGPGFCQIRGRTATRPRSWTSAGAAERHHGRRVDPAAPAAAAASSRDAGRVTGERRRDQVGEVAHRRERAVDRLARQHERRAGARRRATRPRWTRLVEREDLVRMVGEAGRAPRGRTRGRRARATIRAACVAPPSTRWRAASVGDVRRSASAVGSARPSRGRSGPCPSQRSVRWASRPGTDGGAPTPPASIPATSHGGADLPALLAGHPRQPAGDLGGAHRRGTLGLRQRPQQPSRTSRPDPYMTGLKCVVSEPPKISGRDVRIGGAAGVREQAGVVGLRRRRAIDAEPVGEPHRDQRRLRARARTGSPCRGRWPGTALRPAPRLAPARRSATPRPTQHDPTPAPRR